MYTIPKQLITNWDGIKTKLIPAIGKLNASEETKRQEKAQLTGLFEQFDKGLKAKMKVAANAKTDAEARKAAKVVFDTAGEYRTKLEATRKGLPPSTQQLGVVLDEIDKNLQAICKHALASAKSRAPITFTKEIDEIAEAFTKGADKIKSEGKTKYKLDKTQQTSLEDYLKTLDSNLIKKSLQTPKKARSENELFTKLVEMRGTIEASRTKDLPAWLQKTTLPQSAAKLPTQLDALFVTARTNTDRLIKELKTAMAAQ
jgi:predicted HicB family RNase H-like nuclease